VLELTEDDLVESEPEEAEIIMEESKEEAAPMEREPKPVPSEILSSGTQAAAMSSLTKLKSKMPINSSRSYDETNTGY